MRADLLVLVNQLLIESRRTPRDPDRYLVALEGMTNDLVVELDNLPADDVDIGVAQECLALIEAEAAGQTHHTVAHTEPYVPQMNEPVDEPEDVDDLIEDDPAPPAEPPAVEPPAVEPPAVEPPAVEPPAVEPPAVEPPAALVEDLFADVVQPQPELPAAAVPVEPPAPEPPAPEPPAPEPPAPEPPAPEPPAPEPPAAPPAEPPAAPAEPPPAAPAEPPAAPAAVLRPQLGNLMNWALVLGIVILGIVGFVVYKVLVKDAGKEPVAKSVLQVEEPSTAEESVPPAKPALEFSTTSLLREELNELRGDVTDLQRQKLDEEQRMRKHLERQNELLRRVVATPEFSEKTCLDDPSQEKCRAGWDAANRFYESDERPPTEM